MNLHLRMSPISKWSSVEITSISGFPVGGFLFPFFWGRVPIPLKSTNQKGAVFWAMVSGLECLFFFWGGCRKP